MKLTRPSVWSRSCWRPYTFVKSIRFASTIAESLAEPPSVDHANPTGLFGNPGLTSPQAFRNFTHQSLEKASALSQEIKNGSLSHQESILRLDVLSDVICKVVDMAGFVRLSHPNEDMLRATTEAHEIMFDFMNELNTSRELYKVVTRALLAGGLSPDQTRVAEILKHDFEKTGIQFDSHDPEANIFVKCSNIVSVYGQQFLDNIGPNQPFLTLAARDLRGMDPILIKDISTFTGKAQLPLAQLGELALQVVHSSETREKIWRALKSATPQQVETLKQILIHRHGLAAASGYKSFAEYELSDKLMKTPENVSIFLSALQKAVWPKAAQEVKTISSIAGMSSPLMPWDHMYCVNKINSTKRGLSKDASAIMSYFSLENVMQGISDLCESLYGIKFEPGTVGSGEVWSPEVRRFDVYEKSQKIGVIYCDLFQREGKSPNPAHFTIQCSRQVLPWETELYASPDLETIHTDHGIEKYQLPKIALVCDFYVRGGRCFLTFNEVRTLFHEMGHAIHSMIGRTKLHNVAGTRCATDFVELPSILMEKFACEPQVLARFARHFETGKPLPPQLFKQVLEINNNTEQWESYHQILLSLIDQTLHSPLAGAANFEPGNAVNDLVRKYSIFPTVFSQQYAQFGHLVSYGATYYSYLLDRCLANIFWDKLFKDDPLSGRGGDRLKTEVLQWGGSRDPLELINSIVGQDMSYEEIAKHLE